MMITVLSKKQKKETKGNRDLNKNKDRAIMLTPLQLPPSVNIP